MIQLLKQLAEVCRRWWESDRIRVSPRDGAILRLQPGSLLTFAGRDFTVESRQQLGVDPIHLEFECIHVERQCVLVVMSAPDRSGIQIFWRTTESTWQISLEDVQIWTDRGTLSRQYSP